MPDIHHILRISAPIDRVFEAISAPDGLDAWWTRSSRGEPAEGATYDLHFGDGFDWKAVVRTCDPYSDLEYEMVDAAEDWMGTRVGFHLDAGGSRTRLAFRHTGWAEGGEHYAASSYCWAMYLRIMKRSLELGETVPYEARLKV